jgi:hypothetical protein
MHLRVSRSRWSSAPFSISSASPRICGSGPYRPGRPPADSPLGALHAPANRSERPEFPRAWRGRTFRRTAPCRCTSGLTCRDAPGRRLRHFHNPSTDFQRPERSARSARVVAQQRYSGVAAHVFLFLEPAHAVDQDVLPIEVAPDGGRLWIAVSAAARGPSIRSRNAGGISALIGVGGGAAGLGVTAVRLSPQRMPLVDSRPRTAWQARTQSGSAWLVQRMRSSEL